MATDIAPPWEEKLVALLKADGIKAYPMVSPLEADHVGGHVVYNQISERIYKGMEGSFTDTIELTIDARSEDYGTARNLLRQSIEALSVPGHSKSRFLVDRDIVNTLYDSTTEIYRFLVNIDINPYYVFLPSFGARSFGLSFSRSFG